MVLESTRYEQFKDPLHKKEMGDERMNDGDVPGGGRVSITSVHVFLFFNNKLVMS